MEPLASSNPRIKRLRRLIRRRSARSDEGAFVIEGPTNVAEALRSGVAVEAVYAEVAVLGSLPDAVADHGVVPVRDGVLDGVLSAAQPQPVCAVAPTDQLRPLDEVVDAAVAADRPVLVLVDLADPGNAGTLLRSAEAAGAAGVVLVGASVDPYNPKVVRSSAGSIFRVPLAEAATLDEVIAAMGDRPSWAATADGAVAHTEAALGGAAAVVIGNEAHGLSPAQVAACRSSVRVVMDGPTESLNAAMAGTVLLFESMRQRHAAADHNGAR